MTSPECPRHGPVLFHPWKKWRGLGRTPDPGGCHLPSAGRRCRNQFFANMSSTLFGFRPRVHRIRREQDDWTVHRRHVHAQVSQHTPVPMFVLTTKSFTTFLEFVVRRTRAAGTRNSCRAPFPRMASLRLPFHADLSPPREADALCSVSRRSMLLFVRDTPAFLETPSLSLGMDSVSSRSSAGHSPRGGSWIGDVPKRFAVPSPINRCFNNMTYCKQRSRSHM
jgi:hypothetical protein